MPTCSSITSFPMSSIVFILPMWPQALSRDLHYVPPIESLLGSTMAVEQADVILFEILYIYGQTETHHSITLDIILLVARVISMTFCQFVTTKVGLAPLFRISKSVVTRYSNRALPLSFISLLP